MADLVKENESLEQQLTLHITAQKKMLLGDDDNDVTGSVMAMPPPPPPPTLNHDAPRLAK